jgi:hypothetical protein
MTNDEADAVARRLEIAAEEGVRTLELVDARSLRAIGISPHLTGRILTASRELETHGPRLAAIIRTRMRQLGPAPEGKYDSLSREELEVEAKGRDLVVIRADGRDDLDPKRSDYIDALEQNDSDLSKEYGRAHSEGAAAPG